MALRSLGSLLPRALKRHGVTHDVDAARIISVLEEILAEKWGATARRGIKVKFFKDNAIYISCTSSVLAQEVRFNEKILIGGVMEKVGGKVVIEKIRFTA